MSPPAGSPRPPPSLPTLPPALRRELLLVRSRALRQQLARESQVLETPLAIADQARQGLRWLWQHPEWPIGGLVLLALLRPRRAWRWAARGWWAWRLWQRTGRLLVAVAGRR